DREDAMTGSTAGGEAPRIVRAAVVQAAPVAFDLEATLTKVERLTAERAAGGADLVVFPEAFVSCYPRGLTSRPRRRSTRGHRRRTRRPPRDRCHGARRRNAVLHRAVLLALRQVHG